MYSHFSRFVLEKKPNHFSLSSQAICPGMFRESISGRMRISCVAAIFYQAEQGMASLILPRKKKYNCRILKARCLLIPLIKSFVNTKLFQNIINLSPF
jgi:hypothetical protein